MAWFRAAFTGFHHVAGIMTLCVDSGGQTREPLQDHRARSSVELNPQRFEEETYG